METQVNCILFGGPGPFNTIRTLELAANRAKELSIETLLVATSSGATGLEAVRRFSGRRVIAVTHSTGFTGANVQELRPECRQGIEEAGGCILTCQHAFGGVGRAVRRKLDTYQIDEIMAFTLRLLGEGFKVVVEIALMAADAGLVRTDVPVISIAGTGRGADTAVVLRPANAQSFFDLRLLEIICLPAPAHTLFQVGHQG
jgi:hypothetical protein